MKKIWNYTAKKYCSIILFGLLIESNDLRAQITLDTTIGPLQFSFGLSFKFVQISNAETKYYFEDTLTNTFSLYNMDFTPFITNISVPEPFSNWFQVLYITRGLFDCDTSTIEYAYYAPTNSNKPFRILRTDGTILFYKDSVNGPYAYGSTMGGTDIVRPIVNTSAGAKLILQNTFSENFIYSLCGTLPEDVFDFTKLNVSYLTLFPNPTSQLLTFIINVPDNINEYELVIIDATAKEVSRNRVNFKKNNLTINVEYLNGGTYFYSLCTKNKSYQSGKFIITK